MKTNEQYRLELPEQHEALKELAETLSMSLNGVVDDVVNLPYDQDTFDIFNGDEKRAFVAFGTIHAYFDVDLDYEPADVLATFETLNDFYQYMGNRVLLRRGIHPTQLNERKRKTIRWSSLFKKKEPM